MRGWEAGRVGSGQVESRWSGRPTDVGNWVLFVAKKTVLKRQKEVEAC